MSFVVENLKQEKNKINIIPSENKFLIWKKIEPNYPVGDFGSDSSVEEDDKSSLDDRHNDGRPWGNGSSGRDVVSS